MEKEVEEEEEEGEKEEEEKEEEGGEEREKAALLCQTQSEPHKPGDSLQSQEAAAFPFSSPTPQ